MNILWLVLILMVLVLVHEAGHMVVAKWCGMRVERFSIFFGRPLASFTRGETEYAIGWLPLGGYVKISGMTVGEDVPSEVAHRAYFAAPMWKKIATIAAGPAVNILLAIIIFAVVFWIGVSPISATTKVGSVQQGSAAQAAGLQAGDRIVAIDGVRVNDHVPNVRGALQSGRPGQTVRLTVERDGTTLQKAARLQVLKDADGTPATNPQTGRPLTGLGFNFALVSEPVVRSGPLQGVADGWDFAWYIMKTNVQVIGDAFTSSEARSQINSVVGVGAVFNEVADDGLTTVLRFVGVISLALGIFNLIPILPLDGGHILFAVLEKLKGSAFSAVTYGRASFVGLALVMLVFVIALQNDIGRITGEGFQINR
ncbi:MAG TPA: M50 family metallopeptidase [Miltoncostaea sp.]|nr:M50 family metallopeptidase [Miltoncostaea sp.]